LRAPGIARGLAHARIRTPPMAASCLILVDPGCARSLHKRRIMKITRLLLACSLVASVFAGCYARVDPGRPVVRESRSCERFHHWDGYRCIEDRHEDHYYR
jgi:hypothetical protein